MLVMSTPGSGSGSGLKATERALSSCMISVRSRDTGKEINQKLLNGWLSIMSDVPTGVPTGVTNTTNTQLTYWYEAYSGHPKRRWQ